MAQNEYILELREITKQFPGVKALDRVNLRLRSGEILALIGENGAGKSTLINCVTGVYEPDEGEIWIDSQPVRFKNPMAAFRKGISVVHQERNLIPTFNIAENIFLDRICEKSLSSVDRKRIQREAAELLHRLRLDLSPEASIEALSSAQKQMIEIARALSNDARILLLDEPTASISIREADMLLETVRSLRAQGVSIIYVSHKLEEIFAVADRVKVIRDGKSIGDEIPIGELTSDTLVERMVGEREMKHSFPMRDTSASEVVLDVQSIASAGSPSENSFKLKRGEILGFYGLVGAGRTELARAVIGIDPITRGSVYLRGKRIAIRNYRDAFTKHHIYYLSENRKEEGLFLLHSIARNISIVTLSAIEGRCGFLDYKKERDMADSYHQLLDIKMNTTNDPVSSLSGGNQQKVCIAKCLVTDPDIIIIDEPTVGIDVKTKAEIHRLIYELSQKGKSIILISSDLPEVIQLSERILVFRDGTTVGEVVNSKQYDAMSTCVMNMMLEVS